MFNEEKSKHLHRAMPETESSAHEAGMYAAASQFDAGWYVAEYPDVALSALSPEEHYLRFGRFLNRKPNPSGCMLEPSGGVLPVLMPVPKPATQQELPQMRSKPQATALRGAFNLPGEDVPIIRGWLANIGDCRPRTALLQIGCTHSIEIVCNAFRIDLLENKINDGKHAFELVLPIDVIDGDFRQLKLIDKESGHLIAEETLRWVQSRNFSDFSGFLENSFFSPLLYAPFREEDKRCFAVMENIADYLANLGKPLEQDVLVSVIMPVHNRFATVHSSVQSVLEQTYRNFELILIDDGSTDGTYEILSSIEDRRVVVLRNDARQGVSFSRNRGLAHANAELICYLDSDNSWDRRYIAATVGAFRHLPDAQAVFSGQLLFRGEQPLPFAVRFGSFNKGLLENRNYIDLNAFAHTRHALQLIGGFDEELSRFVDWDFILRMSESVRTYSVPVMLSNYCYDKAANTLTNANHLLGQLDIVREKRNQRSLASIEENAKRKTGSENQRPAGATRNISIIIPSYESLPDLKECIESIQENRAASQVRIIVVDNASSVPVHQYLEALSSKQMICYVRNSVNYGFTHAVNQGLELAGQQDDVLLLNNDAVLAQGALDALSDAAYQLPQCGLTVPRQVLPGRTKTINQHVPYACPEHDCDVNLSKHHSNVLNPPTFHAGEHLELSFAPFFCVYIKREILDQVPRLDEKHGRHYRSDRIFCDYIRKILGFKIYHVSGAIVYHKLQRSTEFLQNANTGRTSDFEEICIRNSWNETLSRQLGYKAPVWDRASYGSSRY